MVFIVQKILKGLHLDLSWPVVAIFDYQRGCQNIYFRTKDKKGFVYTHIFYEIHAVSEDINVSGHKKAMRLHVSVCNSVIK